MQKRISLEIIVCLVLIALGVGALMTVGMAEHTASPFLLRQERAMGALDYQSLPRIYALALIALCAANIGLVLMKQRRSRGDAPRREEMEPLARRTILGRTWGTALLLIIYALCMPYVPFFLSTAIFLFLLFLLYGKTHLKVVVPLTLAGTGFFWLVFIKIAALPIGV